MSCPIRMEAPEPRQLPVRLDLAPAESGLGFTLRALRANGVAFDRGMRWLGLERHRPLDYRTVLRIAWALNVDPRQLGTRFVMQDGSHPGWVQYAGMRFRRHVATNKFYAKVCPQCLREDGVAKLSWQLRAAVGCAQHGYSLIWRCPHCRQSIGWSRPDVGICRCRRHFKVEPLIPLEPAVQAWMNWLESVISNDLPTASAAIPRAVLHLSIDGAFRIVEALGLCDVPENSVQSSLVGRKTCRGLGAVVQRGLQHLSAIEANAGVPMRRLGLACQQALAQVAEDGAAEADRALAWWLIQCMRNGKNLDSTRTGNRPRGQLPLFIA